MNNSMGMEFKSIPAGEFVMGTPKDEPGRMDHEVQHKVKLTKPFLMDATLVTVSQFDTFVRATDFKTDAEKEGWAFGWNGDKWEKIPGASWRSTGFDQGPDHPVIDISWNDAHAFCDWLSNKEGKHYRLPTEAEWEYSARAGTRTAYWWGNNPDDGKGCANCRDLSTKDKFPNFLTFNWSDGYIYTSPVGKFRPNAWGLYDMTGNAFEWCGDWYGDYPSGEVTDPTGPETGSARVLRGGSWNVDPAFCRLGHRVKVPPETRSVNTGFRIVLELK